MCPQPPKSESGGKAGIKKLRSSKTHKLMPCCIDAASINSSYWYNKLIGYLNPSRTLNHMDTLIDFF